MINWKKICLASVIVGSFCGFVPKATAGEGGIAASASFILDNSSGNVTNVSTAIAVGKSTAYAGAKTSTSTGVTEAFAVGTGGVITFDGSMYINQVTDDTDLGTSQVNTIASDTVSINATSTGVSVGSNSTR